MNILSAVKRFFSETRTLDFRINSIHIFVIDICPFAFSIFQFENGRSLVGYFSYYEFVDHSWKYVIQIAYKEIVINDKKEKKK
jgi:hypothetical protein